MVTRQVKIGTSALIFAELGAFWVALALLSSPAGAQLKAPSKFPRYCLTLAIKLRPQLREEVSVLDLSIENGTVAAIPRFPPGWQLSVEHRVEVSPTRIFGGATGSVAEWGPRI